MNDNSTTLGDRIVAVRDSLGIAALSLLNPPMFAMRRLVGFRRPGYRESPDQIDPTLPADVLARLDSRRSHNLAERYELRQLKPRLRPGSYLAALYYTDLIDRLLTVSPLLRSIEDRTVVEVLEIGCKNFESAPGLCHAFRFACGGQRRVRLTGVELDAHRIYADWHTRHDYGNYYLSLCPVVRDRPHRFLGMDFMDYQGHHDLVVWFRPFLDPYPLLHWGLPRRYLKPEAMFSHMLDCLAPGAVALIMNQTASESEIQRRMIHSHGLTSEHHIFALDFTRQSGYQYLSLLKKPGREPNCRKILAADAKNSGHVPLFQSN